MVKLPPVRRMLHTWSWRARYWWMDTRSGWWAHVALAVALAAVCVWQVWALVHMPLPRADEPRQAFVWWVAIIAIVVSAIVAIALAPKPESPTAGEANIPTVEDGQAIRRVYGTVWVDDSIVLGWKRMGTDNIRKGRDGMFGGRSIVGYWYKMLLHFGLCRGPIDSFLEIRGGDRTAWSGEKTSSGIIDINKPDLWGGDKSGGEGGIDTEATVMLGEADQQVNPYLQANLSATQSAFRGRATISFNGGRYGAYSAYPKAAAFKLRRIRKGWDNDVCWYPETAEIGMVAGKSTALYFALDLSGSMNDIVSGSVTRLDNAKVAIHGALDFIAERMVVQYRSSVDIMIVGWGSEPDVRQSISFRSATVANIAALKAWVASRTATYATFFPAGLIDAPAFFAGSTAVGKTVFFITDGQPTGSFPAAVAQAAREIVNTLSGVKVIGINIDLTWTEYTQMVDNTGNDVRVISGADPDALTGVIVSNLGGLLAMNPAHMLYDSLTAQDMMGEPTALLPDAHWRRQADKLYAEGFGLCTVFKSGAETVEAFQQRICSVIGARLNKSIADGLWYLDLIRDDYALEDLPVLTDADILSYEEQPTDLSDVVNQVSVKWYDPQNKEDRATAPLQALGAIRSFGRVNSETSEYPEVPEETLALRLGLRDLKAKATPLRRAEVDTTRATYAWRPGQLFRLQSVKRGIADMVCMVGDKDSGTLRSGAINLQVLQSVFGMPDTAYVEPQPIEVPSEEPQVITQQRAFELPYVLLAANMTPGEFAALGPNDGYVGALASDPDAGVNFTMFSSTDGGGYEEQETGEWCASATSVADVERLTTQVAIADGYRLDAVALGSPALWDEELLRVDAIDLAAGTVVLGRGCGDTVPTLHASGSRLYFLGQDLVLDPTQRVDGQLASVALASNTYSARLPLSLAVQMAVGMDGRASRPYPAQNFCVNGDPSPSDVTGSLTFTWIHRDRTSQAGQLIDAAAGSIGPEAGVLYDLVLASSGGAVIAEFPGIDGDSAYVPASVFDSSMRIVATLQARRGHVTSMHSQVLNFNYSEPKGDMQFEGGYMPPEPDQVDLTFAAPEE